MNGGTSKQYDDSNRGVLFPNKSKKNDKHPDYTGNLNITRELFEACQVDGKLDVSAWSKTGKNGGQFISLSISKAWKKDGDTPQNSRPIPPPAPAPAAAIDFDDRILF